MRQNGYQAWSRQQIAHAVQYVQEALLAHVPTEQAHIYRAVTVSGGTMITLTGNMAEFWGKKDLVSMARSLRLAMIQNQFSCGNLTEQEARELLSGPLSPGDSSTIHDDSSSLQKHREEADG